MEKKLEAGARVRVTPQYVDNVVGNYKEEARELVGQEGFVREKIYNLWAIDLDMEPHPQGVNWLFYENELELIS